VGISITFGTTYLYTVTSMTVSNSILTEYGCLIDPDYPHCAVTSIPSIHTVISECKSRKRHELGAAPQASI
jgi:hypothetical protein